MSDEWKRRLDALAAQAPDGDELVDRWQRGRRRPSETPHRRLAPVLAVLVAATVVAVAAVGLSGLGGNPAGPAADRVAVTAGTAGDPPAPTAPGSDAPVSARAMTVQTREVGRGRLVVAVPVGWRAETPHCGTITTDGYYFWIGAARACRAAPSPGVVSVRIEALSAIPEGRPDPRADRVENGVAYGLGQRRDGIQDVAVIASAQEDVRIVVQGPPAAVRDVVSTARILPDGEITVPELTMGVSGGLPGATAEPTWLEIEKRLTKAGLRLDARTRGGAGAGDQRLRVTPPPGTVVEVGSVVRVDIVARR
ncbi:hypothetical protein FE697_012350 [Mumia zhuanghuii]|uniref:PASTA domain-containing protein n=2 Tax=Mumia TaxID=1546255 RepID=A0ABW1QFP6_9ACTN|nr:MULTISPECIES: hypothetical protein [Mumia]KAA1422926.1 hypothetical protein FE697_012350 [Mumia zhuanghuii]